MAQGISSVKSLFLLHNRPGVSLQKTIFQFSLCNTFYLTKSLLLSKAISAAGDRHFWQSNSQFEKGQDLHRSDNSFAKI